MQEALRDIGDFEHAPTPLDDKTTNGARMTQIAKSVLAEYNKKENKNFSFMRIDKADLDDNLCAGHLYHMSIRIKDKDSSEKIIEKMVWKGSSLQVEERSEVTERPIKTAKSVSRPRIKKMVSLVEDAESRFPGKEAAIKTKGVIVEEEFLECIPKGEEEYIYYTRYKLYFTREQGYLCYSVLHRKWLYTLDDSIASTIRQTLNDPKEDQLKKPTREGKRKISDPLSCCSSDISRKDLQSPLVLSFAWFFIEDYNFKKHAQVELLEVSQANILMCAGVLGELSIKAIDQGVIKFFDVTMYSVAWLKSVDIKCQKVKELSHEAEMEHRKKRRV